jgi:hypothetical protein
MYGRWPVEAFAVGVERWPVHRGVALSAGPGGVPAAVPETNLMTHQHLLWPESVPVWATRRRVGDPLRGCSLHQLTQHDYQPMTRSAASSALAHAPSPVP